MSNWRMPWQRDVHHLALALLSSAVAVFAASIFWKRRRAETSASLEDKLATATSEELLADVGSISKAVLYTVSNKTNDAFSEKGLAKYLRMKGLPVHAGSTSEETLRVNGARLLEHLRLNGDGSRPRGPVLPRHTVVREGMDPAKLTQLFPEMKAAYMQQPLDYGRNSRYGDKWKISCYLVVLESWKPKIEAHLPMVRCMSGVMQDCVDAFVPWYCQLKRLSSVDCSVMNAFVTRYTTMQGEEQLEKHIDGANVGGTVILALPTDDPFEGGCLRVWDGKPTKETVYEMKPGDVMFLDNAVWHQAMPISSGTRWALVLFLRLQNPHVGAAS